MSLIGAGSLPALFEPAKAGDVYLFWKIIKGYGMDLNDFVYDMSDARHATPEWYAGQELILNWILGDDNRQNIYNTWHVSRRTLMARLANGAVRYGNAFLLDYLLYRRRDLVQRLSYPIWVAAGNGHVAVLDILLNYPGVDRPDWNDVRHAVENYETKAVRFLLTDPRVNLGQEQPEMTDDYSVVVTAVQVQSQTSLDMLLEDPRTVSPSAQNNLALRKAVELDDYDAVETLLHDPRVSPVMSEWSEPLLTLAARKGSKYVVEDLLYDNRIDPTVLYNGKTPLDVAMENSHWKVVKRLLQNSRVRRAADIQEVFQQAVSAGRVAIVNMLLEEPQVDPSAGYNRPIITAARNGHTNVVYVLIRDDRVDPGDDRNQAIRDASFNGHAQVVAILIRDVRVDPSDAENSAIRHAKTVEVAELLLRDKRVDPSAKDNEALRRAAWNGRADVVRLLLRDPRVRSRTSINAAFINAAAQGHLETARVLLVYGNADPTTEDNLALLSAATNLHIVMVQRLLKTRAVRDSLSKERVRQILADVLAIKGAPEIDLGVVSKMLEDFIRERERGQALDEGEPPVKMLKDKLKL